MHPRTRMLFMIIALTTILMSACRPGASPLINTPLFSLLDKKQTHIDFVNQLESTEQLNTYTYRNFYNGAGVGLGDFNNDGLADIYFCGNQKEYKLYINKGNFVFEDVTDRAGVSAAGSW